MVSSTKSKLKRARRARTREVPPTSLPGEEFLNRELSWLKFNQRVLFQVENPAVPLLERIRFLTITTANLDEFFMNRVGRLKDSRESSLSVSFNHALEQQLRQIRSEVLQLVQRQDELLTSHLIPSLHQNGISLLRWADLSSQEREAAEAYFDAYVFQLLTPQAVDPGHPFPALSNLSLSLGIILQHPDRPEELFARLKVPDSLPQLVHVPSKMGEHVRAISLLELLRNNLDKIFPGMVIRECLAFRITRHAALQVDDFETEDLRESISEGLRERKFASLVRLEHEPSESKSALRFILDEIALSQDDVYITTSSIQWLALRELVEAPIQHLKFESWSPVTPPSLNDEDANIFNLIRHRDLLVHHPYESFTTSVERFLRVAANDPKVLSIKMTLYRAGDNSSLIPLLVRAAEMDKQVVVLIELKASMDEARNIRLTEQLEEAGVHVMYGVMGLKTHAKAILVARSEPDGIRCYAHLGTGNYNPATARVYTDLGLFTSDREVCGELVHVFNYLTGRSLKRDYRHILVAPVGLKEGLLAAIEREIEHHQSGRPAHIIIKANGLEDSSVCRALSKAAVVGVPVDLIIRGICCVRPTLVDGQLMPRVVSIIGRFLEHSRIYFFRNGATEMLDGTFWISSADPMFRNLNRRVELAIPIRDPAARQRCWEILTIAMHDQCSAWDLNSNGDYILRRSDLNRMSMASQDLFMKLARDRSRGQLAESQ